MKQNLSQHLSLIKLFPTLCLLHDLGVLPSKLRTPLIWHLRNFLLYSSLIYNLSFCEHTLASSIFKIFSTVLNSFELHLLFKKSLLCPPHLNALQSGSHTHTAMEITLVKSTSYIFVTKSKVLILFIPYKFDALDYIFLISAIVTLFLSLLFHGFFLYLFSKPSIIRLSSGPANNYLGYFIHFYGFSYDCI